jgi:hypothetical protein
MSWILGAMGLDEAKLEELRRWGQTLREARVEESVAAGRAILMLIEELERLRIELWRAREQLAGVDRVPDGEIDTETGEAAAPALHARLQQLLGRDPNQSPETGRESFEETGPSIELEEDTAARSWIETLRRQK